MPIAYSLSEVMLIQLGTRIRWRSQSGASKPPTRCTGRIRWPPFHNMDEERLTNIRETRSLVMNYCHNYSLQEEVVSVCSAQFGSPYRAPYTMIQSRRSARVLHLSTLFRFLGPENKDPIDILVYDLLHVSSLMIIRIWVWLRYGFDTNCGASEYGYAKYRSSSYSTFPSTRLHYIELARECTLRMSVARLVFEPRVRKCRTQGASWILLLVM